MGFLRRPGYYREFSCIASACTDSCCAGWEIDIDEDTYEFYKTVKGPFGERLLKEIAAPEEDEPAHFRQTRDNRCPFLNEENLCDIFTELGEEHLSWICTHHPRFYDWFQSGMEAGLGLCCEEAARLLLINEGPDFEVVPSETEEEEADPKLSELEELLFGLREEAFAIIRSEGPQDEKRDRLFSFRHKAQKAYDDVFFGEGEETWPEEEESFTRLFWRESTLRGMLSFYQELDINDPAWWRLLKETKEELPEIISARPLFEEQMGKRLREYDSLLIHYLFRYFMKGREDGMIGEKLQFALYTAGILEALGIHLWLKEKEFSLRRQIELLKLYSKEIDYDEENSFAVSEVCLGAL